MKIKHNYSYIRIFFKIIALHSSRDYKHFRFIKKMNNYIDQVEEDGKKGKLYSEWHTMITERNFTKPKISLQKMRIIIIFSIVLLTITNSFGQDSAIHQKIFPGGISIDYGLGYYAVRDEYFSEEKYTGTLPYFAASWSRFHNKHGYHRKLEYRSSSEIKNNNISTDIIQFSLHGDYLYPIGKFAIRSKDIFVYLGPSTEFFLFYNKPNYMEGSIHINYSFLILVSGGINCKFIFPLQHGFQIESSAYLSLLSLGIRTPEIVKPKEYEDDAEESPVKLLLPFSGLNTEFNLGARYYFLKSLSIKLTYKFQLTRIQPWDPLLMASDNIILSLTYHFKKHLK